MSRSNVLQFELSIEAAAIADASIIVKARIIEAADTVANMDVGRVRPAAVRSFWPQIQDETVGGHSVGYGVNGNRVRYRPSSAAVSRAEEVSYGWMLEHVHDDERRIVLGRWAMCLAAPRIAGSFRAFCKKTGRSRSTADRRIDQQISDIAAAILKNAQSLQEPNWSRVVPMIPNSGIDRNTIATPAHWMAEGAKPRHIPEMLEPLDDAQTQRRAG
ncbi:DUF6362 family protein [Nitratireductor thuwali]|uniref:DUF6362 domain-containing protein n=1 Tax=Nitratireductor thuwali TaxID=2267699 RepID=A0ABY5MQF0_9HYPH|nr:hypothetical protein NTH_04027 [Nitratireductor thuwali]